ncbi:hypothetical protein FYK55_04140 [Roseiconus nitratireducens]|uniref:Uncharacterized protein n=1 Tax=Roseiconus nitratireducens TaxID=2605748 RepID=A0A5M6DL71_9BACT|nr:hypothetical protein [Roseiconus nitratireducens]KAA5546095.1 hypothetical protein FYK55_04140 [Roseiconus nitratireducens]
MCLIVSLASSVIHPALAGGELFDSLDAYPPRWHLDRSDCDARILNHRNLHSGGADGGACESIEFHAGLGSEVLFVYSIEPVRPTDDLVANVSVMSARRGSRIGLRVRFPYLRDPQTRRPVSAIIYGATYERAGKFESIGIGSIERPLRIKQANLRGAHGASADVSDPYVDAIVINAYSGRGDTGIRVDSLSLRGMIPIGDHGRVDPVPGLSSGRPRPGASGAMVARSGSDRESGTSMVLRQSLAGELAESTRNLRPGPAFPHGRVIRILEHQGEPLNWVRRLGFDAVLIDQPPTAELLREAIQSRVLVYAPPPTAPDPELQTLLDPVVAWYLGGGVALDNQRVEQTDKTVRRLRRLPGVWQRPIVVAPTESWPQYASLADGVVTDAPPRGRDLSASEQSLAIANKISQIGGGHDVAIAIQSSLPNRLTEMNRAIENSIGVAPGGMYRWHSMWAQTVQALEHAPRALLFRSNRSLVSGDVDSQQRSMALSYVNRFVAMISPWLASSEPVSSYTIEGAPYRCGCLRADGEELLLISSQQARGDEILAGDGKVINVLLPPGHENRIAWRMTHFSAQRVDIDSTPTGAKIQIVSPDVCELLVISGDAGTGVPLNQSALQFARHASADRWQLTNERVAAVRAAWSQAVGSGATESLVPVDLMTVAERTLRDAEPAYRAGDAETTLRLSSRADAWGLRSAWQLTEALMPGMRSRPGEAYVSSPPMSAGHPQLQIGWQPLMGDEGWSENLIAAGGLDRPEDLGEGRWEFAQRQVVRSRSSISWVSRGFFDGRGAARLVATSTTPEPLGGGYEGTVAVLSSPPVSLKKNQAVRIDAMIRTIGFGAPHQGVLVYDSLGGPEMGVLVRGATEWTPVRLYRQSFGQEDLKVHFEIIGDGEAIVDEVSVRAWAPEPLPTLPLRRISENWER